MLKSAYLKDIYDVDPFNINVLDGVKYSEQGERGVDITEIINYKTPFVVNVQQVTVSLSLVEEVACNTIFSCAFLQAIKASIITNNKALVSGLLGK